MSTPTIIGQDQTAIIGAKSAQKNAAMQPDSTDKFFNTLSEITNIAGPTAYYTTNHLSGGTATSITPSAQAVSAAINASSGSMGYGSMGGFSTGMSGMTTMGGGLGMSASTTSTGGVSGNLESIISETANSQAYLLGIQMQMGNQQTMFTSVSNAMNVKHGMMRSVINNFRVS